jgi:IMP dehydrogenase
MDTVTESAMAIALAKVGGLGIIHKNISVQQQTEEVNKVKRSANGIIGPDHLGAHCLGHRGAGHDGAAQCLWCPDCGGIRQAGGNTDSARSAVSGEHGIPRWEVMTRENLVTATGKVTLEEAEKILTAKKVEKLLLVDESFRLTGLITIKDIDMMKRFPNACKDDLGRLRVGAAVGVHDFERAQSLIDKGVDVLVVDSAHGHSSNVLETVRRSKSDGISTSSPATWPRRGVPRPDRRWRRCGQGGIGPGSICTTRVISGVGVPQVTAIWRARS